MQGKSNSEASHPDFHHWTQLVQEGLNLYAIRVSLIILSALPLLLGFKILFLSLNHNNHCGRFQKERIIKKKNCYSSHDIKGRYNAKINKKKHTYLNYYRLHNIVYCTIQYTQT